MNLLSLVMSSQRVQLQMSQKWGSTISLATETIKSLFNGLFSHYELLECVRVSSSIYIRKTGLELRVDCILASCPDIQDSIQVTRASKVSDKSHAMINCNLFSTHQHFSILYFKPGSCHTSNFLPFTPSYFDIWHFTFVDIFCIWPNLIWHFFLHLTTNLTILRFFSAFQNC